MVTHPLYPPPLSREGEEKERGALAPLKLSTFLDLSLNQPHKSFALKYALTERMFFCLRKLIT